VLAQCSTVLFEQYSKSGAVASADFRPSLRTACLQNGYTSS
jgi:hypothetical protein